MLACFFLFNSAINILNYLHQTFNARLSLPLGDSYAQEDNESLLTIILAYLLLLSSSLMIVQTLYPTFNVRFDEVRDDYNYNFVKYILIKFILTCFPVQQFSHLVY